jgi:tryptophanyl-tRNA synthetase
MPQDPKVLKRERREALACLLACGLGPGGDLESQGKRATLFFQEEVSIIFCKMVKTKGCNSADKVYYCELQVPEHAELAWYFNTLTGVGKLQRMTTWKVGLHLRRTDFLLDRRTDFPFVIVKISDSCRGGGRECRR